MKVEGRQENVRDVHISQECSHTPAFAPEYLAGMTRLELANQLIEGQPAFHFAFIPAVKL
jgi:hypothetical protein